MALSNSDIKHIRSLHLKKFRDEKQLFLVEGQKMVSELIRSEFETEHIYHVGPLDRIGAFDPNRTTVISEKELARISNLKNPNAVLAIARIPSKTPIELTEPLVLALDGIRDPGNLGTMIRTARWFGVSTILCSEGCAEPFNPKVVQSTMGALFHVQLHYGPLPSVLELATRSGFRTVAASMDGQPLRTLKPDERSIIVIGSESHGISPAVLDHCIVKATIPNLESEQRVESLNAAVASALFLNALSKQPNS